MPVLSPSTLLRINSAEGPPDAGLLRLHVAHTMFGKVS